MKEMMMMMMIMIIIIIIIIIPAIIGATGTISESGNTRATYQESTKLRKCKNTAISVTVHILR
jgi:competence protein ComGC